MAGWARFLDRDGETVLEGNALGLADLFAGSAADLRGTLQASSTSATTLRLPSTADSTDDAYLNYAFRLIEKNVIGSLTASLGSTAKLATMSSALTTAQQPTSTDTIIVFASRRVYAQNVGTRTRTNVQLRRAQVGDNDGYERIKFLDDTGTCIPPAAVSVSIALATSTTTGLAAGTYYVRLASLASTGVTNGSPEVSFAIAGTSEAPTYTWTNHALSTGTRVFRSTASGVYTGAQYRALVASGTATYLDDGAAASSGTLLSTANTVKGPAPDYGYPPTLGTAAITIGTVVRGQMVPLWIRRDTPIGADESLNPRLARIELLETT